MTRSLEIGMRVRLIRRHGSGVGTIREFVEPSLGRRRALVNWDVDGMDQFVDVDKLEPAP